MQALIFLGLIFIAASPPSGSSWSWWYFRMCSCQMTRSGLQADVRQSTGLTHRRAGRLVVDPAALRALLHCGYLKLLSFCMFILKSVFSSHGACFP